VTLRGAMKRLCALGGALLATATLAHAQPTARDVRQLVTFLFQPGKTDEALRIYERDLMPVYRALEPMRQFRLFREAESPEPLDVVVMSAYTGMAGMDAANTALRTVRTRGNTVPVFAIYGELAALSQHHHDQFVVIDPRTSDRVPVDSAPYVVFEYLRVAPGAIPWVMGTRPRSAPTATRWTEGGPLLISDGWDLLFMHHVPSLAAVETVVQRSNSRILGRKVMVLRTDGRFSIR
jgi:hypothetical protein